MDLRGRIVYITGGSSGIGLAFAKLCATGGAGAVIFARDRDRLESALAEIKACGKGKEQRFGAFVLDVADNDMVERVMHRAVAEFGSPYVLFCSAGLGGASYFEKLSYERFDATMKINVYGVRNVAAALVPHMKERGGHIVNVSSMGGFIGVFGYTAYSASKFAVVGFSECLRSEMKPFNIAVSVLCPPDTDTPMMRNEDAGKPVETKEINKSAGLFSAEYVARAALRGIAKKRFIIIPGAKGRAIYLLNRLFPWLPAMVMDATIRKARRGAMRP
jgi:3-dehydrosphinganine reductase